MFPPPRLVGALDLELVLANALETGGAECARYPSACTSSRVR